MPHRLKRNFYYFLQFKEDGIKQPDYDMSLSKFWKENVPQDNDNIGFITTFLYLSSIDKIVYGTNDGTIIILSAIQFLIRHLFKRKQTKSQSLSIFRATLKNSFLINQFIIRSYQIEET